MIYFVRAMEMGNTKLISTDSETKKKWFARPCFSYLPSRIFTWIISAFGLIAGTALLVSFFLGTGQSRIFLLFISEVPPINAENLQNLDLYAGIVLLLLFSYTICVSMVVKEIKERDKFIEELEEVIRMRNNLGS